MTSLDIYIGFNSSNYGQQLAYEVCKRSLLHHNPNLKIHKLVKKELEDKGIFNRTDNTGSTEFTYTRFLVPYLNNYEGYALFCDSDFLWQCNIKELFDSCIYEIDDFDTLVENDFTVACVKHEYQQCNGSTKMNGLSQEWYPRKNWSSLMLFNCNKCKNLTPLAINSNTPKYLHRMEWCTNNQILSIDKSYNYLVDYYGDLKDDDIKALHFTDGGPWHPGYEDCLFADQWLKYLTLSEKMKLIKEMALNLNI